METISYAMKTWVTLTSPHSLGTLIEWKLKIRDLTYARLNFCPHSLGTLIEWKR